MNFNVWYGIQENSVANGLAILPDDVTTLVASIKAASSTDTRLIACGAVQCFISGLWDAWDAWRVALARTSVIDRKTVTEPRAYREITGGIMQYGVVEALPTNTTTGVGHVAFVIIERENPTDEYVPSLTCPGFADTRRKYHNEYDSNTLTCTFGWGRVTTCLCDFIGPCPGAPKCMGCVYADTPPCAKTKRRAFGMELSPSAAATQIKEGMTEAANAIARVLTSADAEVETPAPMSFKHYIATFSAATNADVTWTDSATKTVAFSIALSLKTLI